MSIVAPSAVSKNAEDVVEEDLLLDRCGLFSSSPPASSSIPSWSSLPEEDESSFSGLLSPPPSPPYCIKSFPCPSKRKSLLFCSWAAAAAATLWKAPAAAVVLAEVRLAMEYLDTLEDCWPKSDGVDLIIPGAEEGEEEEEERGEEADVTAAAEEDTEAGGGGGRGSWW